MEKARADSCSSVLPTCTILDPTSDVLGREEIHTSSVAEF